MEHRILIIKSGTRLSQNFAIKILCSTRSNALLKSRKQLKTQFPLSIYCLIVSFKIKVARIVEKYCLYNSNAITNYNDNNNDNKH